jgi:hypothetical protein
MSELTAYGIVFGGIALFTAALSVLAVWLRRSADAEALAMRAQQVVSEVGDLLVAPGFFWGVWHDTARAAAMTMLIRDAQDEVVCTVTSPALTADGVLRRFDLDGRRYEIRKAAKAWGRTCLVEVGQTAILLSAEHATLSTTLFRGGGAQSWLRMGSAFGRYRPIEADDQPIGKLIVGLTGHAHAAVLTLPAGAASRPEQVFLLASA